MRRIAFVGSPQVIAPNQALQAAKGFSLSYLNEHKARHSETPSLGPAGTGGLRECDPLVLCRRDAKAALTDAEAFATMLAPDELRYIGRSSVRSAHVVSAETRRVAVRSGNVPKVVKAARPTRCGAAAAAKSAWEEL